MKDRWWHFNFMISRFQNEEESWNCEIMKFWKEIAKSRMNEIEKLRNFEVKLWNHESWSCKVLERIFSTKLHYFTISWFHSKTSRFRDFTISWFHYFFQKLLLKHMPTVQSSIFKMAELPETRNYLEVNKQLQCAVFSNICNVHLYTLPIWSFLTITLWNM